MCRVMLRGAGALWVALVMTGVGLVSAGEPADVRDGADAPPSVSEHVDDGSRAGSGVGSSAPLADAPPASTALAGRRVGNERGSSWDPRPAGATRPRWHWPVTPRPPVLRPFRAPVSAYGAGHRGLDLAVTIGMPVLAVEDGRVTHAGAVAGRGTVTVEHRDGLRSTYEPVGPTVHTGDVVAAGDVLGRATSSTAPGHCGGRACLHLGARREATYLDPLPLLAGGRLALLPLG